MTRWSMLESKGWEFSGFFYVDGFEQIEATKLKNKGYEVRFLRERTDTKGLKMVSIWKRKAA